MAGGELDQWGTAEHLLAAIYDALKGANWQRGGGKGTKPKPLPRPGDAPAKRELLSGDSMSPAELDAELARRYKPAEPTIEEVD